MLKFKKILGYYGKGEVVVELEDGRYTIVPSQAANKRKDYVVCIAISSNKNKYLRVKQKTDNLERFEEDVRKVLSRDNLKIRDTDVHFKSWYIKLGSVMCLFY